jgi:hypothetical protein
MTSSSVTESEIRKVAKRTLEAKYQLSFLGELKWFLGVHVLRDRHSRQFEYGYLIKLTLIS